MQEPLPTTVDYVDYCLHQDVQLGVTWAWDPACCLFICSLSHVPEYGAATVQGKNRLPNLKDACSVARPCLNCCDT